MRASASHRIKRLSHRIGVSDAGPRIASSASEKPMRRIGIASISRCDARYFAGDADIIGRHRLNLGCDSVPEVDSRESSPRVTPNSESNFKFKRHVQPKLNTTSIRWTRRSESDSPQVEHDINSLDSSLGGGLATGIGFGHSIGINLN
ncbi:hypothetical protein PGTUg99_026255 [Puccinia graminis f. sp. tritici]|uniref:Uncharacterized protein n=1 Tax=Puccinia graminis f. sp. tritici TaxID=56615 RepID=A0A5B0SK42_PUCGR|nr:hypothetical protein PGTUg99_026255 [Puccinia graminis f. sp. tritici]